jgi:hypothetical protein
MGRGGGEIVRCKDRPWVGVGGGGGGFFKSNLR